MMELDQRAHVAPIVIHFMIECATSAQPGVNIWPCGWDSPAGRETRQWLQSEGLVDHQHRPTERGRRWLDAILSVPLPDVRASLPSDDEVGRVCERLRDGARSIAIDGTPAQVGPSEDEIIEAAALIQSQAAELAAMKVELLAAWNAFGPSSSRSDKPAFDTDDLEHLPLSAGGGLVEQIHCLEDRAERAEAALAEKDKALEWRGIESAPKDGTRILAYTTDAQRPAVHETWWFDGFWRHYNKDAEKFYPSGVHGWFPDRWMPLPAARRAHSKDGGEHV